MYKRDDYLRNKPEGVFSKWQGFARSMLLPKPFSETAELRRTVPDYSLISRDLAVPKGREDLRVGKEFVGRYRVKESIQGLGVAFDTHDVKKASSLGQTESIRTRLRSYGRSVPHQDSLKKIDHTESQTITQKKVGNRSRDKKHGFAEETENSCVEAEENNNNNNNNVHASILRLSRSKPQPVLERHDDDDVVDESGSASVCGVLQEDGTTCSTAPVLGRKRCTEHKGQRISCLPPPAKEPPCEEETEEICGVILPDMVRCRSKPVSRRKRCEDHKGMRVNAFFFLLNPTEREKIVKEDDNKSKPETRASSTNQEEPGQCEATTKNGLPCTRNAPKGSRRCWQHKESKSSENVQTSAAAVTQAVCGVKLYDGSVCEKPPVKGRKRCQEHKGIRITS